MSQRSRRAPTSSTWPRSTTRSATPRRSACARKFVQVALVPERRGPGDLEHARRLRTRRRRRRSGEPGLSRGRSGQACRPGADRARAAPGPPNGSQPRRAGDDRGHRSRPKERQRRLQRHPGVGHHSVRPRKHQATHEANSRHPRAQCGRRCPADAPRTASASRPRPGRRTPPNGHCSHRPRPRSGTPGAGGSPPPARASATSRRGSPLAARMRRRRAVGCRRPPRGPPRPAGRRPSPASAE